MMQTGATEKLRSPNRNKMKHKFSSQVVSSKMNGLLIITVTNNGESSSFANHSAYLFVKVKFVDVLYKNNITY